MHALFPCEQRENQLLSRNASDVRLNGSPRQIPQPNVRRSPARQANWPRSAYYLRAVDRRFVGPVYHVLGVNQRSERVARGDLGPVFPERLARILFVRRESLPSRQVTRI